MVIFVKIFSCNNSVYSSCFIFASHIFVCYHSASFRFITRSFFNIISNPGNPTAKEGRLYWHKQSFLKCKHHYVQLFRKRHIISQFPLKRHFKNPFMVSQFFNLSIHSSFVVLLCNPYPCPPL